jgi:hypothetical protein
VYVSAIGPSVAARLAARGIRAATAPAGARIDELLGALCRIVAWRSRAAAEREPEAAGR